MLTDAAFTADMAEIFADLAGLGVLETVTRIPAGETANAETFEVIRGTQRTNEELLSTGFMKQYRFTIYAMTADIGATTEGDVIVMADETTLRVFRKVPGPAKIVTALDLGDEAESGEENY